MYTNEQLAAMTSEQLKAAILELQAAEAVIVTDTTQVTNAIPTAVPGNDQTNAIQTDIEKIEATIEQLKAAGEDLFSEEIANLKIKLANAQAEIESAGKEVEDSVTAFLDKLEPYRRWITTVAVAYLVIRVLL
jgi:ABC-type transporter Mla subunit MlaD